MEYVRGKTLKEELQKGALSLKAALYTGSDIAAALEVAHQLGIVHRDLKPSNVIITPQGHVKVMDFGLAKRLPRVGTVNSDEKTLTTSITKPRAPVGTLTYMSPEQLRGEPVDTRSDIFSFGVLLYEMLTGTHPFKKLSPWIRPARS